MATITESLKDDVYTVMLNRPEKKNAMNFDMFNALRESLKNAAIQNPSFIVLRGSGRTFCSGGDIVDFRDSADKRKLIDAEAAVFNESIKMIRKSNAIVIAVLEGVVIGAGAGLAAACDLSIAAKKTIMNMGYRRIGLTPDGGGSLVISRLVGAKRFNELYLLSRNIPMDKAQELGLVNFVVEEDELETSLQKLIDELKALPTGTIGYFKELVNRSLYPELDAHLDMERQCIAELAGKKEFQERLEAFLNKK